MPSLDHVVELGIAADAVVADEETRADIRMGFDQAGNQRHDWIGLVRSAEQYLVTRVGKAERRCQRRFREILNSADRPYDRDACFHPMHGFADTAHASHNDNDAGEVKSGGNDAECFGRSNQNCHSTRATPDR
jgi:hypothetical protein